MTAKLFKPYSIKPELTIDNLTYGIGLELGKFYIYLKKRKCQWAKRHGPFRYLVEAKAVINQIKDEYNAVNGKRTKARSQI